MPALTAVWAGPKTGWLATGAVSAAATPVITPWHANGYPADLALPVWNLLVHATTVARAAREAATGASAQRASSTAAGAGRRGADRRETRLRHAAGAFEPRPPVR